MGRHPAGTKRRNRCRSWTGHALPSTRVSAPREAQVKPGSVTQSMRDAIVWCSSTPHMLTGGPPRLPGEHHVRLRAPRSRRSPDSADPMGLRQFPSCSWWMPGGRRGRDRHRAAPPISHLAVGLRAVSLMLQVPAAAATAAAMERSDRQVAASLSTAATLHHRPSAVRSGPVTVGPPDATDRWAGRGSDVGSALNAATIPPAHDAAAHHTGARVGKRG